MNTKQLGELAQRALQARLVLRRLGWSNNVAGALCLIAVFAWLLGVPYFQQQTEHKKRLIWRNDQMLRGLQAPTGAVQRSAVEERLAKFYDALGEKKYVEQQIKTLFSIAGKLGLQIRQAEYQSGFDKIGRIHTYQILLPVRAPYDSIRLFCEQVLLTIPFASLDEINFRRDTLANGSIDATLRFTLFLADGSSMADMQEASSARGPKP